MNTDISFELYKVFYFVAKLLSFSEASKRLCITQSAVSQSIKTLEEKLNCRLFLRSTKQVRLTPEGELLFKHAEQAFNFIKAGERGISEMHSLKQGTVRIGASDTICKYYLLPRFQEFIRLYPQIKIQLTNRTSPKCLELLKNGLVDAAVVNIPEKQSGEKFTVQNLKEIHDVFVAGNSFRHLKNKKITLKELERLPLLMLEKDTVTRRFFDDFTRTKGVGIIPEIELGSIDLLMEMARIGLGISHVIREFIEKELASGEVFTLDLLDAPPPRYLGVVTNNSIPLPMAAQKFIELLV